MIPMDTLTKVLPALEDMEAEARKFIEELPIEVQGATLVTLSGDLGAGKTTFTQFIAKALGIVDVVNSPTFVIEKIYTIPENPKFERLIHIDAYRLKDAGELTALGFGQLMSHEKNLIFLEWPENVVGISEHASIRIVLEALPDGSRQITYA
jgi:tRNA threonylcarbamoyladenosine biosynthesis protein TsaE